MKLGQIQFYALFVHYSTHQYNINILKYFVDKILLFHKYTYSSQYDSVINNYTHILLGIAKRGTPITLPNNQFFPRHQFIGGVHMHAVAMSVLKKTCV